MHTSWQLPSSPRLSNNNFDLLRLVFAAAVCLVHAQTLSGYPALDWIEQFLSSKLAVEAFFVISGFLIFMSYERASSLTSYSSKRLRRIYPAYFTIVMLCALSLWSVSSLSISEYFSNGWLKYVISNLLFLNFMQQNLPGVFTGHSLDAVNGALWTLKIEVMFYISVPVFVYLFRRLGHARVILAVYILSLLYTELLGWQAQRTGSGLYAELARQLPGQLTYFMAGAALYYFLPWFERRAAYIVAAAAAVFFIRLYVPVTAFEPIALAALVIFFGLYGHLGNFSKYGDFSYGVYIIHFPIIQLFLYFGISKDQPYLFLLQVVLITLCGAALMWHFVEKRFLLRNNHYAAGARAPTSIGATP